MAEFDEGDIMLMAVEFNSLKAAGTRPTTLMQRLMDMEDKMIDGRRQRELGDVFYPLFDAVDIACRPMPAGWEKLRQGAKDGFREYFASRSTAESSWDDPRGTPPPPSPIPKAAPLKKAPALSSIEKRRKVFSTPKPAGRRRRLTAERIGEATPKKRSSYAKVLKTHTVALSATVAVDEMVTLNVGGTLFSTLKSTLLPAGKPHSMFNRLLSAATDNVTDGKGNPFIDGQPSLFEHILHFLRRGVCKFESRFDSEMRAELSFLALDLEVTKPTDACPVLMTGAAKLGSCRHCGLTQRVLVKHGEPPLGIHECKDRRGKVHKHPIYTDAQIVAKNDEFTTSVALRSGYSYTKYDWEGRVLWVPTELLSNPQSTLCWRKSDYY